jgi:hypothetical protein
VDGGTGTASASFQYALGPQVPLAPDPGVQGSILFQVVPVDFAQYGMSGYSVGTPPIINDFSNSFWEWSVMMINTNSDLGFANGLVRGYGPIASQTLGLLHDAGHAADHAGLPTSVVDDSPPQAVPKLRSIYLYKIAILWGLRVSLRGTLEEIKVQWTLLQQTCQPLRSR